MALLLCLAVAPRALAQGACAPSADGGCARGDGGLATTVTPPPERPATPSPRAVRLVFFWGVGCPHCEEATPAVARLAAGDADVLVERVEVRESEAGRLRFRAETERLGVAPASIPLFVIGDRWVVGFQPATTEARLRAMLREARGGSGEPPWVDLPMLGRVDPRAASLPWFTLVVGLIDGLNPCAFYVLVALLGVLLHVRSRARVALFGATFVLMSGLVYFLFMAAWLHAFALIGAARAITRALGAALVAMGLVNLKELVWFKRGVSLMIPEKAKPGLLRRMRVIAQAASLPAAVAGIAALAFVVNLVELGCTLGLPAMYTRALAQRTGLSAAGRYAYLALYNVAYVIPLGVIVAAYAITLQRLALTEARAKALKAVSGVMLVAFGLVFLLAPQWLQP
jgi:hypothetical protein